MDGGCDEGVLEPGGGTMRVLYLFAGKARPGSFDDCLYKRAGGRVVVVNAVDVARGSDHDLTKKKLRKRVLEDVRAGLYFLVAASPPCSTFSRARMSGRPGPPPLRSDACLRGFPSLRGHRRRQALEGNLFADFSVQVVQAQVKLGKHALLEHPEDLGQAPRGDPGSLWRWPEVRRLVEGGCRTGAFLQSAWGRPFPKHTRLLYTLSGLDSVLAAGWPAFDDRMGYVGPLRRTAARTWLRGRSGQCFTSRQAADWPEQFCDFVAGLTWEQWGVLNLGAAAPADGGAGGADLEVEGGEVDQRGAG